MKIYRIEGWRHEQNDRSRYSSRNSRLCSVGSTLLAQESTNCQSANGDDKTLRIGTQSIPADVETRMTNTCTDIHSDYSNSNTQLCIMEAPVINLSQYAGAETISFIKKGSTKTVMAKPILEFAKATR